MKSDDMRRLERELKRDLIDSDPAVFERTRDLVKEFLMECATRVTGKRVRVEKEIQELIHMHARIALLQRLVEKPNQFSAKDLKDIFRETAPADEASAGHTNILAFIQQQGGKDAKAIEAAAVEAAANAIRKQLPRSTDGSQG